MSTDERLRISVFFSDRAPEGGPPAPDAGAAAGASTGSLDTRFAVDAKRRLGGFAIVMALGFVGALIIYRLLGAGIRTGESALVNWIDIGRSVAIIALAGGVFWRSRSATATPKEMLRLGLALELCAAFAVSVPLHRLDSVFCPVTGDADVVGIPWVCVLICIFPLFVPARAWVHGVVAFASASMFPASVLVQHLVGWGSPDPSLIMRFSYPAYLCAVLATVSSAVVWRMGRDMSKARDEARALGSYVLQGKLGEGGMGEVWRACHATLKRPAAIKLIRPDKLARAGDPTSTIERFTREARATARLRSQHTIEIYDYGRTACCSFFYAMELLDGVNLQELVEQHGAQPPARVVHILKQAALSLAEAHESGLVHRDIKPANIFLCRQGIELDVVKVLDFGLVLDVGRLGGKGNDGEAPDPRLTAAGEVVGTPAFFSPELVTEGEVDHRADIYALGCVAYFLLTGTAPFDGKTPMKIIMAHAQQPPEPPTDRLRRPLPEALERLILKCLEKSPKDRPQTATELHDALLAIEETLAPRWTVTKQRAWWSEHQAEPGEGLRHSSIDSSPTELLPERASGAPPGDATTATGAARAETAGLPTSGV